VALCRLLLKKPDILLLDEPTNHLDAETVAWLEHHLQQLPRHGHRRHPRPLLPGQRGRLDPGTGPGRGDSLEGELLILAGAETEPPGPGGKNASERQKTLQRELEWIRMSPKGRHAKGKARISSYEQLLLNQESEKQAKDLEIYIPPGPRLGGVVVEFNGVSKGYGDRLLYENLTFNLPPGGIVGVIGPNGAGKTTLFRMITGQEQCDSGSIRIGETVKLAYMDQSRDALNPEQTIWEAISGGDGRDPAGQDHGQFPRLCFALQLLRL
jgi:energy-dependent translational throttle protein EttA